jgi:hypothetical protein
MRPSVTEQLQGLRRILDDVIAPELTGSYPRDILSGVCATLESIAEGWQQVPAFLDWDIRASSAVLAHAAKAGCGADDVEALDADPYDLAALENRHRATRAALERVVPAIAADEKLGALRTQLAELFRERAQRYPLKVAWRPPVGQSPQ